MAIDEFGEWRDDAEIPAKNRRLPLTIALFLFLIIILLGVLIFLRITRSPAPVTTSQVTKVVRGTVSTLLKNPQDVALFNGKFYITDSDNHRVVVFAESGEPLFDFKGGGPHGVKDSGLVFPVGIAINSSGDVFVADMILGKVVVFSESGRSSRFINLPGAGKRRLKPLALTIDSQDNLYVGEAVTGKVYIFDKNGKYSSSIGKGKFAYPGGIAINNQGEIYVADSNNQRIVVFNRRGKFLRAINPKSQSKSFLPRGLAFDRHGELLVADALDSRILEFNRYGHEVSGWGAPGDDREEFNYPKGIAYSRAGLLYVVDSGNNRVTVWQHLR